MTMTEIPETLTFGGVTVPLAGVELAYAALLRDRDDYGARRQMNLGGISRRDDNFRAVRPYDNDELDRLADERGTEGGREPRRYIAGIEDAAERAGLVWNPGVCHFELPASPEPEEFVEVYGCRLTREQGRYALEVFDRHPGAGLVDDHLAEAGLPTRRELGETIESNAEWLRTSPAGLTQNWFDTLRAQVYPPDDLASEEPEAPRIPVLPGSLYDLKIRVIETLREHKRRRNWCNGAFDSWMNRLGLPSIYAPLPDWFELEDEETAKREFIENLHARMNERGRGDALWLREVGLSPALPRALRFTIEVAVETTGSAVHEAVVLQNALEAVPNVRSVSVGLRPSE